MSDEAMREAFEADAGPMGFDLRRQSIAVPEPWAEYADPITGHRWAGWVTATERAAKVCEAEHVGDSVEDECDNKGDYAYNMAPRHAAAAIRKGEPS